MKCRLIQTSKIADQNRAEKELLSFLTELPDGYTIYRELQVSRAYEDRIRGMEKAQPDFVVVGREIGLLSIEVKDWNLNRNQYIWRDQYKVVKLTIADNEETTLDNPAAQADMYRYAFMGLLKDVSVWVTSIVAFPRLSRQAFLNGIADIQILQNPQSRFFLDLETVIFKEDIDEFFLNPDTLLKRIVRKKGGFHAAGDREIHVVNDRLLPNAFRIGDLTQRQQEYERLKMITMEQEKWIFDLDRSASYLLDVAGSGKTNVLVSRAIHIIDLAHRKKQNPPNILLTTYNPNLQRNIERFLDGKIKPEERQSRYRTLRVENVEFIMERIAITGYGFKRKQEYNQLNNSSAENYQQVLHEDVRAALQDSPDKYRVFDYVFIDEIQDFDDEQLYLVRRLARTDNFFFVGDIGQKIYDRYHDLKRHGFVIDEIDLPKTYKMYRTPRYIGELAHRFVMADTAIRAEFEAHGYRQDTQFESYSDNAAELLRTTDSISTVVERIDDLIGGHYREDDVMVITSEPMLMAYITAFEKAGFHFSVGEPRQSGHISLVDFMNVKGLEREIVLISGIEDLYDRSNGLFDDPATQLKEERFSRRKIYVSLTRAIEGCIVYYTDPTNHFISELININKKIMGKRQAVK
jgi:hypothetical protein